MKVRELTNLIGSCDVRRILAAVRGHVQPADDPGKDTGLPVFGECSVSPYPVYFGLESSGEDYRITIGQKAAGAVKDTLPGAAKRLGKWYCLSADLRGYCTIPADKVPLLCRKVGYLGGYVVMVDTMMPGGGNEVQGDVYALLADMVLRFDTKAAVRDEAIKVGCRYVNGPASAVEDMPHIALAPRADIAIEYDFRLNQWRRIENLDDVSSLHNKTQHRDFIGICQPGKVSLTGEDIAKLVLSTQEAINTLGQVYYDNLDELLTPTRFKVLHPLDTKGYFLRMSASTIATASTKAIYAPAISHFPVWLHDTLLDKYYEVNLGLAPVDVTNLPENREVAGTLGHTCEVIYDVDAQDVYDTQQLAYLAMLIMKSKYPAKEDEGIIAMYGCMEHLNSVFAPLLIGKGIDCLPEIKGTRIENLNPDPNVSVGYDAVIGLSTSCAKALSYSANSDTVVQIPEAMSDREHAITGECTYTKVKSFVLARALTRFSEAKPFEVWEAGLLARMTLELEDVPPAFAEYFSKAPHVKDPVRVTNASWAVLKVGDAYYTVTPEMGWAELVNFKMPDTYLLIGEFFCGELYCLPTDMNISSDMLTQLITSTAQYFVSFDTAPTVFKYLYNMDMESGRWSVTGVDQSSNCIMIGAEGVGSLCYDPATWLWSYSSIPMDNCSNMGPVQVFIPDELKPKLTVELLDAACRSVNLCLAGIGGKTATTVPLAMARPRVVPHTVSQAEWTLTINGQTYADNGDGDWALYTGEGCPDNKQAVLDEVTFLSLLLNYFVYFVRFQQKDCKAYAVVSAMFDGVLEEGLSTKPEYEIEGYMWLNRNRPMAFGSPATFVDNPGFLSIKNNSSSNIMGVSYYLDSSIGVITLEDFLQVLTCLNSVDALFKDYTKDKQYTQQEIDEAFSSFVAHQKALCDAYEAEVADGECAVPILKVGPYAWDGERWYMYEHQLPAQGNSLWGYKVGYDPSFLNMPISVGQAVIELMHITTLAFEPAHSWFPILETIRKR